MFGGSILRSANACGTQLFRLQNAAPIVSALLIATRHKSVKSRSLAPDDPFGEKAASSDPSEDVMHTFEKFDDAAFDTAISAAALQGKHFGSTWTRVSTLGRHASEAMRSGSVVAKTHEELHALEQERQREVMSTNYATYEEYLIANEARRKRSGAALDSVVDQVTSGDGADEARQAAMSDVGDGYRLNQIERSQERLREAEIGGDDGATSVGRRADDNTDDDDGSAVPLPSFFSTDASVARSDDIQLETDATTSPPLRSAGEEITSDTLVLPLVDPQQWTTEQVIMWIRAVGEEGCMDDSMQQAYEMMRVDGNMLLQKINPNTMFKNMRKWHVKRKGLLSKGVSDGDAIAQLADEFRTSISVLHVQETIYLCYPYGRY